MNKNHDHPEQISAFPREDYQTYRAPGQSGMTLRDYFAAKAMHAFIGRLEKSDVQSGGGLDELPFISYAIADSMLKEREAKA
jgi:hypothetical protein